MRTEDLDYELPDELIAQAPPERRDASRLLVVRQNEFVDEGIGKLVEHLPKNSLIVFNDTRVIPARLRGFKPSGGKVEFLLVDRLSDEGPQEEWVAFGKASKGLKPGLCVRIADGLEVTVLDKLDGPRLKVSLVTDQKTVSSALTEIGEVPLPPYIRRQANLGDAERYQTVFAAKPGAIAAPTAGLHFTPKMLAEFEVAGHELGFLTLHVGPGTFRPVKSDSLDDHPMHTERCVVPETLAKQFNQAKTDGRPCIAIGTTVVRTLEAAVLNTVDSSEGRISAGEFETDLLIQPGYVFKAIDGLLTNFHLPRSTLLALVMALGGRERVRDAYQHAVQQKYRFFSYGDAMFLRPESWS